MDKLLSVAKIAIETPESFTLNIDQNFLEEVGEGVLKLYPRNVFDGLEVIKKPIPAHFLPIIVEEASSALYDILLKSDTNDKIEEYISRHKKYRILGLTACNLAKLTSSFVSPSHNQIIGYGEKRHGVVSLSIILSNYGKNLVKDYAILVGAGELAHAFGIQHHENCLIDHGPKKRITEIKNYFCEECVRKFETGNYAIEGYNPPNKSIL
jgi:predicted Zn-dependent protease